MIRACNNQLNGRATDNGEVAVHDVHDGNPHDVHGHNTVRQVGEDLRVEHNVPEIVTPPEPRLENFGTENEPIVLEFITRGSRLEFNGIIESLPIVIE